MDAAIEAISQRLRDDLPGQSVFGLSGEQSALIRTILGSGDLVRLAVGPAGTGKTEAMRAVVHAVTAARLTVISTIECERRRVTLDDALALCRGLGTTLPALVEGASPADRRTLGI